MFWTCQQEDQLNNRERPLVSGLLSNENKPASHNSSLPKRREPFNGSSVLGNANPSRFEQINSLPWLMLLESQLTFCSDGKA